MTCSTTQPTDLLGRWSLRRRVVDRHAGVTGRVEGTLELSAVGDEVRWVETGTLRWLAGDYPVTRELVITRDPSGWMVRFADGREFHPWLPGMVVTHPCRADVYRGLITIDRRRTRLRVLWDVAGPSKNQRLVTTCRPLPATPDSST
ncbi:MAG: hypothetical protein JO147_00335 [Actinobacteria bacterium]|nr:hypothetical protein [Actinomycetota bacterium]